MVLLNRSWHEQGHHMALSDVGSAPMAEHALCTEPGTDLQATFYSLQYFPHTRLNSHQAEFRSGDLRGRA